MVSSTNSGWVCGGVHTTKQRLVGFWAWRRPAAGTARRWLEASCHIRGSRLPYKGRHIRGSQLHSKGRHIRKSRLPYKERHTRGSRLPYKRRHISLEASGRGASLLLGPRVAGSRHPVVRGGERCKGVASSLPRASCKGVATSLQGASHKSVATSLQGVS